MNKIFSAMHGILAGALNVAASRPRAVMSVIAAFAIAGCATPQERAIAAYCLSEGMRSVPQLLQSQQVLRSVYVGDRQVGHKNKCTTAVSEARDKDGKITKTTETICRDEPIMQAVYQDRLVNEVVDLNAVQRQGFVQSCTSDALARGMYANLK